ncbi:MAG: hypothetical protein IPP27_15670 [Bacteroidetes bacterium]|nr:hypothetical protein [Bacteroidota bacterium]
MDRKWGVIHCFSNTDHNCISAVLRTIMSLIREKEFLNTTQIFWNNMTP